MAYSLVSPDQCSNPLYRTRGEHTDYYTIVAVYVKVKKKITRFTYVMTMFMTYHRFLTRLTRRVSLVEQELLTLPESLSSSPVLNGVRVTRTLVLCVCFVVCSLLLVLLTIVFSVDIWILITPLVSQNSSG